MSAFLRPASETAILYVFRRFAQHLGIVPHMAQGEVAGITEDTPVFAGRMAVVNNHALGAVITSAEIARVRLNRFLRLFWRHSVLPDRVGRPVSFWTVAIPSTITLATLLSMLSTIFADPCVLTFPAPRLANALCDIVEPVIGDWTVLAATGAFFRFHSISHSRTFA